MVSKSCINTINIYLYDMYEECIQDIEKLRSVIDATPYESVKMIFSRIYKINKFGEAEYEYLQRAASVYSPGHIDYGEMKMSDLLSSSKYIKYNKTILNNLVSYCKENNREMLKYSICVSDRVKIDVDIQDTNLIFDHWNSWNIKADNVKIRCYLDNTEVLQTEHAVKGYVINNKMKYLKDAMYLTMLTDWYYSYINHLSYNDIILGPEQYHIMYKLHSYIEDKGKIWVHKHISPLYLVESLPSFTVFEDDFNTVAAEYLKDFERTDCENTAVFYIDKWDWYMTSKELKDERNPPTIIVAHDINTPYKKTNIRYMCFIKDENTYSFINTQHNYLNSPYDEIVRNAGHRVCLLHELSE